MIDLSNDWMGERTEAVKLEERKDRQSIQIVNFSCIKINITIPKFNDLIVCLVYVVLDHPDLFYN